MYTHAKLFNIQWEHILIMWASLFMFINQIIHSLFVVELVNRWYARTILCLICSHHTVFLLRNWSACTNKMMCSNCSGLQPGQHYSVRVKFGNPDNGEMQWSEFTEEVQAVSGQVVAENGKRCVAIVVLFTNRCWGWSAVCCWLTFLQLQAQLLWFYDIYCRPSWDWWRAWLLPRTTP